MVAEQTRAEILVVDDEPEMCRMLAEAFESDSLTCTLAFSGADVERLLREREFDVVVTDIGLPDRTGLDILHSIREVYPATKTVLITGHRRQDWARQALRDGAFDYLEKPFDISDARDSVQRALKARRVERSRTDPRQIVDRYCRVVVDIDGVVCHVCDNFAGLAASSPSAAVGRRFEEMFASAEMTFERLVAEAGVSRRVLADLRRSTGAVYAAEIRMDRVSLAGDASGYIVDIVDVSSVDDAGSKAGAGAVSGGPRTGHDPLTGLPNHSSFQEELSRVRYSCRRYGRSVSILSLEIVGFRQVNAKHGFVGGDELLVSLGRLIRRTVRLADYVARYSGSRLAVIMPETDGQGAMIMAERLLDAVKGNAFSLGGREVSVEVRMGLAECQSGFIENQDELVVKMCEALNQSLAQQDRPIVLWQPALTRMDRELASESHSGPAEPGDAQRSGRDISRQLRTAYMSMSQSLVAAVEAKDPYTKNHSLNVAEYAEHFARQMGLGELEIGVIRCAGTLHDVGKIGIPDAILQKPSRLSAEEFETIKQHPIVGSDIVGRSSFLAAEAEMVRHHHERQDGSGYPDGLMAEQLSIGAKILQVADAMDTMLCARSYKRGYDLDHVIDELRSNSGGQFDAAVAEMAIEMISKHPERLCFADSADEVESFDKKISAEAASQV